jgi:hypothetical protein
VCVSGVFTAYGNKRKAPRGPLPDESVYAPHPCMTHPPPPSPPTPTLSLPTFTVSLSHLREGAACVTSPTVSRPTVQRRQVLQTLPLAAGA